MLDRLVIPVGSNTQFIPTAKLLKSFERLGISPVKWLIVTDSDTSSEMPRILDDLGYVEGKQERNDLLGEMSAALKAEDIIKWLAATRKCNSFFAKRQIPVVFLEADLEYAALSKVKVLSNLVQKVSDDELTKSELLKKLGSKGVDCKAKKDALKATNFAC